MTQTNLVFTRSALQRIALVALAAGLTTCAVAQTMPASTPAGVPAATAPTQTPPMNGIAHIAIRVQSIANSLAFYNKLGYQQAFAWTRGDVTTQSFLKLNDTQYIELYPVGPAGPPRTPAPAAAQAAAPTPEARPARPPTPSTSAFMHLCFEGADLHALHDFYVAEGLTPSPVNTAAAGNLLFVLRGPQQATSPQTIEYTQYMPGSKHTLDFGQHLSADRVADKMIAVTLAMQDPAAARDYYLTKLGFKPDTRYKGWRDFLDLPGNSGEMVEIVPAASLGVKSKILMTSPDIHRTGELLKAKGVPFTDGDTITVTDPDGNIIEIVPQAGTFHGPTM
ncbi:MAG: VOC family protein [Acidobacteriaceae bacterium]